MGSRWFVRLIRSAEFRRGIGGAQTPTGGGEWGVGVGELFLSLHCHHHTDAALKWESMGTTDLNLWGDSDREGQITRQCPQTTTFEQKGDPGQGIEPTSSVYQAQ